MKRRLFLRVCTLASLGSIFPGCRRAKTRDEVLSTLVREVAAPDAEQVGRTSEELLEKVRTFTREPTVATLRSTRSAWREAALAWKRAACFRNGPMVETNALLRAAFWPASAMAIEPVLAASNTLDEQAIAELGVNARGIYALEYLLFPLDLDDAKVVQGFVPEAGKRRRQLALGLAQSIAKYATTASRAWGDGAVFARTFAEGGQLSLNKIVGQMVANIESLAMHHLDLVIRLEQNNMLQPSEIEGWPSGISTQVILAQLTTCERLYRGDGGGGLADLVHAASPAIAKNIEAKYGDAITRLREIHAPLEQAVKTEPAKLSAAAASMKALEVVLKSDLTSALGINLTFSSGDGD